MTRRHTAHGVPVLFAWDVAEPHNLCPAGWAGMAMTVVRPLASSATVYVVGRDGAQSRAGLAYALETYGDNTVYRERIGVYIPVSVSGMPFVYVYAKS